MWIPMIFWQQFRGSWYNLGHYSYQIPLNAFLRAVETPSPYFYDGEFVPSFIWCIRPCPLGSLQRSPKPHPITGLKGGFAAGGNGGGLWEKVAKEEGKGETEREREGEGNGVGE